MSTPPRVNSRSFAGLLNHTADNRPYYLSPVLQTFLHTTQFILTTPLPICIAHQLLPDWPPYKETLAGLGNLGRYVITTPNQDGFMNIFTEMAALVGDEDADAPAPAPAAGGSSKYVPPSMCDRALGESMGRPGCTRRLCGLPTSRRTRRRTTCAGYSAHSGASRVSTLVAIGIRASDRALRSSASSGRWCNARWKDARAWLRQLDIERTVVL